MLFSNIIKGQVSQTLVKILLERAGYRVTRLGIEELFQEVVHLDASQYASLNLPKNLRFLPDLLVADSTIEKAFLVEVKFRKSLDKKGLLSLYDILRRQLEHWPETYTILMVADPGARRHKTHLHQDHIRVLRPEDTNKLIPSEWHVNHVPAERQGFHVWKELSPLYKVFEKFRWKEGENYENTDNADLIATALKDLGSIAEEQGKNDAAGEPF